MMEIGPRELMTLGTVVSGLAATWGMVRSQLGRAQDEIGTITKELASLNQRLDLVESTEAVQNNKLETHGVINSVSALDKRARFEASVEAHIENLERRVNNLTKMHNGEHIYVPPKETK